ncbi:MAG: hypothetical protein PHY92_00275 [Alphaproteobacteria bacterium]|nr:hypothetical protein [Alphaproteobacteria bacterium]
MTKTHFNRPVLMLIAGGIFSFLTAFPATCPALETDQDIVTVEGGMALMPEAMAADRAAAGTNSVVAAQTLTSTVSGSSLTIGGSLTNGAVSLGDNFGSGLGSYVMNTGNNSSLTSAVNVSIQTLPAP